MVTVTEREKGKTGPRIAGVMSAMGLAMIALAFASIFITKLERASVPPLVIAFYRMALATVLLLPAALALKQREITALGRRDIVMLLAGGFFLAVHFGAWISSLAYIPIATSVVLVNSHPLLVVIASRVFLGERPTRSSLIGTASGLAGMVIIGRDGFGVELALVGDALALVGAVAVVGYILIGRKVRARVSLLGYVTPLYGVCAVLLLIWLLAAGHPLYPYDSTAWFYFAALAVIPTILGHTVFNWVIKHVRPSAVSVAFLGEPVVASLLALIFFGQQPPFSTLIGGALILAGIYLTMSSERPANSKEAAQTLGSSPPA